MSDPLLTLLDSPDPAVRTQGMELARALGPAATDRVLASCVLEPDGLLWRPPGLSVAVLSLLLDAPVARLSGIRRLILCGPNPPELLARLAQRLPGLEALILSAPGLADLSSLTTLPLRTLELHAGQLEAAGPILPQLADLAVEGMEDAGRLIGLPVTKLELIIRSDADLEAVCRLTALRSLRILEHTAQQLTSLSVLASHPTLLDVTLPRHRDTRISSYSPAWVPGAERTRMVLGERYRAPFTEEKRWAEVLQRASEHWWAKGFCHQLTLESPPHSKTRRDQGSPTSDRDLPARCQGPLRRLDGRQPEVPAAG
ncbi:MAG: hypothetical protein ACI8RZ_001909 [Myxococcota bacterium]